MRVVQLIQRTAEWKQWRTQGVTATDSPVLLGRVPEKTIVDLWLEKSGRVPAPDLSAIPAVRFGNEHEDYARELWEVEHLDCAQPICGEWDENPIFRASFDGLTASNEVVEIKCPFPNGTTLLDVRVRRERSEAYQRYYPQVQHQLLVANAQLGHLVFLDGESLLECEIRRDEKMIEEIIKKGEELHKAVVEGIRPCSGAVWSPKNSEEETLWREAAEEFLNAQTEIKAWKELQKEAKTRLQQLMGNFDQANFGGIKVSRSFARNQVSIQKIVEAMQSKGIQITEDVLDCCTGTPSERWSFKPSNEEDEKRPFSSIKEELGTVDTDSEEPSCVWF